MEKGSTMEKALNVKMDRPKAQIVRDLRGSAEQGEPDLEYAASMLSRPEPEIICAALAALMSAGEDGAWHVEACARHLKSPNSSVRSNAAAALGALGPAAGGYLPTLKDMAVKEKEAVRVSALYSLGLLGGQEEEEMLVEYADDPSPVISVAACQAICLLGDGQDGIRHLPLIAGKMADPRTRFAAVACLESLGPETCGDFVDDIIRLCMSDPDHEVRQTAVNVLRDILKSSQESSVASVARLLTDSHAGIRCSAAMLLGLAVCGDRAEQVAALLDDSSVDTSEAHVHVCAVAVRPITALRPRCSALVALGEMGACQYATRCATYLTDERYEVRVCALEALSHMETEGRSQSASIAGCLDDVTHLVRMKACECIGTLGAEDVMTCLPEVFADRAPSVRLAALNALAMRPNIAECFPSEVAKLMLNDPVPAVKAAAIQVMGKTGDIGRSYAPIIASQLTSEDDEVQVAACQALGWLGENGAAFMDDVRDVLNMCTTEELRAAASEALAMMESCMYVEHRGMIENLEGEMGDGLGLIE